VKGFGVQFELRREGTGLMVQVLGFRVWVGRWRVEGGGWRVEGGGWRVEPTPIYWL